MPGKRFLEQQLEYVQREVIREDFPDKWMASGRLVPISNEVPRGARTYTYRIMSIEGMAKVIASGATDLPAADVFYDERTGKVQTLGNHYSFTSQEIDSAMYAGVPLPVEKALAARETMEQTVEHIAFLGQSEYGLEGFLNQPNVSSITPQNTGDLNGATNSPLWVNKTGDEILEDMYALAEAARIQTNYVELPNIMSLPSAQFNRIKRLLLPDIDKTVLEHFLETERNDIGGIEAVYPVPFLAGRGPSSADIAVVHTANPSKIKLHMPSGFRIHDEQVDGFAYKYPCSMEYGGVQLTRPRSMFYMSGI